MVCKLTLPYSVFLMVSLLLTASVLLGCRPSLVPSVDNQPPGLGKEQHHHVKLGRKSEVLPFLEQTFSPLSLTLPEGMSATNS